MKYKKNYSKSSLKNKMAIHSIKSSTGDKYYTVDTDKRTCTCPNWKWRCAGKGLLCKHLIQAINIETDAILDPKERIILDIKCGKNTAEYLEEKYGNTILNILQHHGFIMFNKRECTYNEV